MSIFKRRKGRTSFLERNQLVIGILAALFVLGGSAFSLLLSGGVFSNTYKVTAHFADAAGLRSGDDVKVAGLDAGKISSVDIDEGSVAIAMKISDGIELPEDSSAEITIETLLGRKSVTLYYGDGDKMLGDGGDIPLERTRTPVSLIDLADTSTRLLNESDADALEHFIEEISKVTRGKREQVTALINGLGDATAAVDSRQDELARLIDSLRDLSGTFAERDDTLIRLIDNFDSVLGNLAQRTDDLQELLISTDAASHEIADLVGRNRETLDSSLEGLRQTLEVLDKHQIDLAESVDYLENAVRGYASVGYSQGTPNRWANIFVQSLGPAGIDAFFGPCGTLDQALDDLLGPDPRDCNDRAEYGEDNGRRGATGKQQDGGTPAPSPSPTADAGDLLDEPPLPGDLGDILDNVTGSTGLGQAIEEGLL